MFMPTIGKESLHSVSNDNGTCFINFDGHMVLSLAVTKNSDN